MSNGQPGPSGTTNPLTRDASTGQDNTVKTVPFSVTSIEAGEKGQGGKWDPSKDSLRVRYRISDENSQAKSGRILYFAKSKSSHGSGAGSEETIVHTQALTSSEIKPGKDHTTSKWDGSISQGLNDRVGKKVTADLSPIGIRVEIWNQSGASPGKSVGAGKTDVPGQYVSSKDTQVLIDLIAEAKWERPRCIPFIMDPDNAKAQKPPYKDLEPELGVTKMKIRLNAAEGTPVRIAVLRIVNIDDHTEDTPYARSPTDEEMKKTEITGQQDGLYGAMVEKGGRVTLADGKEPYIQWNLYKEHWKTENENNFYCFKLAIGKDKEYVVASERDCKNKEKDCLHMRFTVAILCPWTVPPKLEYTRVEGNRLHVFFRKETKYFRSYLLTKSPEDIDHLIEFLRNRYIVIFLGHASCTCFHKDARKGKEPGRAGFAPDQDKCPKDVKVRDPKKADKICRCGTKPDVGHILYCASGKKATIGLGSSRQSQPISPGLYALIKQGKDPITKKRLNPKEYPRLIFHTGTCRTVLTTNMAQKLVDGEGATKYFSGHTHTSSDGNNLGEVFFKNWIKGNKKDKLEENDVSNFVKMFVELAARKKHKGDHPRITDFSRNLSADGPGSGSFSPFAGRVASNPPASPSGV